MKSKDVFFLTLPNGQVPAATEHALGLYYHDCRFLDGYEFSVGDREPDSLVVEAGEGGYACFELTNPDVTTASGMITREQVAIRWERTLDGDAPALHDVVFIQNFGARDIELPLSLSFRSRFEDLFVVRGRHPGKRGHLHRPRWSDGQLVLQYDGLDRCRRRTTMRFSPAPDSVDGACARFSVTLPSRRGWRLDVSLEIEERSQPRRKEAREAAPPCPARPASNEEDLRTRHQEEVDRWRGETTHVESDNRVLDNVVARSLLDLHILTSTLRGRPFFAGGVPWFVTLFGRDSLIAALQTLAFAPRMAESTLRLLASYQGERHDARRDEEPGKIAHELRVGELAHRNQIPQTPYYGSIDATPLFLILVGRHASWTGDLTTFRDLRDPIDRALRWIETRMNGHYLSYASTSKGGGLSNQGWKDSSDAIVNGDGSLATPPIALPEVQAYVYLAWELLADLYARAGDAARAEELEAAAADLRERFNRDFWLESEGVYALALQRDDRPATVVSSNAGQVLCSGIADPAKARRTREALMSEAMFSGWGIRTLSTKERRFNPIGYHVGTVWPHDNSLIAAGLCRYGFCDDARRVFQGVVDAAATFAHDRLPEVFGGFAREDFRRPVRYPVACHPQAWAAGSVPFFLESLLGLTPEAFERRLRIRHPTLPDGTASMILRGLRVGSARVDLRFQRRDGARVSVDVLECRGELEVRVDA